MRARRIQASVLLSFAALTFCSVSALAAESVDQEIQSVQPYMNFEPGRGDFDPGALTPEEAFEETGRLSAEECARRENQNNPACFLIIPTSGSTVDVYVDLSQQQASVYVNDLYQHTFIVSSGRPGHSTPTGDYQVWNAEKLHLSRKYENAPMPLALPFTSRYHALHCGNVSGKFLSHGCVRMEQAGCETMWQLQGTYGFSAIRVHIAQSSSMLVRIADPRDGGTVVAKKEKKKAPAKTESKVAINPVTGERVAAASSSKRQTKMVQPTTSKLKRRKTLIDSLFGGE